VYTGTLAVYGHHHSNNHNDGWTTLEAAVTQILQQVLHALTLPEEEDDNDNSSHRLWWSARLARLGVTDLRGAPEHSGVRSAPASNNNNLNRGMSVFVGMGLTLLAAVLVGGAAALVRFLWLEQHYVYSSRAAQQEPQRGPTKQPSSTPESSTTGFRHDTGCFWSHLMTFFRGGKDADDKTTADSYCDSMMSQAPSTGHSSTDHVRQARRWRQRMVRAAHNNYGNDDSRRHAMLATVNLFAPAGEDGCDPDDPYIVEPDDDDDDDDEWTDVWLGNSSGRNQVDDDDGEFSVLYQQDKRRGDEDPLKFPTVF